MAVWCPDWPVTAARLSAGLAVDTIPAAVVTANRVVACSHAARSAGVRRGLRRREAQARCPELVVLARNEAAEARPSSRSSPRWSRSRPASRSPGPAWPRSASAGPTRYFGGETGVLHALSRAR